MKGKLFLAVLLSFIICVFANIYFYYDFEYRLKLFNIITYRISNGPKIVNFSIVGIVDFLILGLLYYFLCNIGFKLTCDNNEKHFTFLIFRTILIGSTLIVGLNKAISCTNEIYNMFYEFIFSIVILILSLYILIVSPLIENRIFKDFKDGLYKQDMIDNLNHSSSLVILNFIIIGFIMNFIYFRKSNPGMSVFGFLLVCVALFVNTFLNALIAVNINKDSRERNCCTLFNISVKFISISLQLCLILFIILSLKFNSKYIVFIVLTLIISIICFISLIIQCSHYNSYTYLKQRKENDKFISSDFDTGSAISYSSSYSSSSYTSSSPIKSNICKPAENSNSNNKNNITKQNIKVKEIYTFESMEIRYYESNPHKSLWEEMLYDYEGVGYVYFKSNLGNEYKCYVRVIYKDCSCVHEAKRIFNYNNESTLNKKYEYRDFVHINFF